MSAPFLARLLSQEECADLSDLLEAKYLANLGAARPAASRVDAGSPLPSKPALSHPLVTPYSRELYCDHDWATRDTEPAPPPDPWDLASAELNMSASLRLAPLTCASCDGDGSHCEECGCP